MPSRLLTPPAAEPLTLAEAKAFLRVEHDADDAVIAALVTAARGHVEAHTRRALLTQTWRLTRDDWPADGRIAVTPSPLQALVAACVTDAAGIVRDLDSDGFAVDAAGAVLTFTPGSLPPSGRPAGIALDVTVGYGDAPAAVPEPLRQAVRMLTAHWYENRGVAAADAGAALLPLSVAALLAPYRAVTL